MMPGRILVREGYPFEGMHVVARGRLMLRWLKTNEHVGDRYAGGYIGEKSLLNADAVAPWTCMTADWSELLLLRGEDFRTLSHEHPELRVRVRKVVGGNRADGGKQSALQQHENELRKEHVQRTMNRAARADAADTSRPPIGASSADGSSMDKKKRSMRGSVLGLVTAGLMTGTGGGAERGAGGLGKIGEDAPAAEQRPARSCSKRIVTTEQRALEAALARAETGSSDHLAA